MEYFIYGTVLIVFGISSLWRIYKGKNTGLGWIPPSQTYFLRKDNKNGIRILFLFWNIVSIVAGFILIGKALL